MTGWLRSVAAVVAEVVRLVLVEPVRDGRLRADRWPTGLGAIVALALTAFATAAALVLAAPWVRRHSELMVGVGGDLVYPRWTTGVFLALTVLTLALLHAASLHLSVWLRLAALVVVVLAVLGSALDTVEDNLSANVASFVGAGLLVLLTLMRWRASFRWWEFAASLLIIGGSLGAATRLVGRRAQPLGFDTAPQSLSSLMQLVSQLAIPFTLVAGLAFAQLAILLAHRVGGVVDERVRRPVALAVLVAVVAAVELVLVGLHLRRPTTSGASRLAEWAASGLLLVLAVGLAVLVLRAARAEGRLLDRMEEAVSLVPLPVGFGVAATIIAALVLTRVDSQITRFAGGEELRLDGAVDFLFGDATTAWTRIALALALLGCAFWLRHRRPLAAALAATVGVVLLLSMAGVATDRVLDLPWTSEALADVAAVVAVVLLVGLAAARRLDRTRLVALGTALGLSLAYSVRSTFDAPFVALLGLGAGAAVFVGVVWTLLTGAADANAESPGYPRPARVLFFLANALLAMTTLAFVSVADAEGLGIDVSVFGRLGDDYLGTGLLLAAYATIAWELLSPRPRCSPST